MNVSIGRAALVLLGLALTAGAAQADRIKNPTAVFSGLDKITGRIVSFEVAVAETVQFGGLQMTPKVCFTRPSTESPNTTSFVEVDEIGLDSKVKRIFAGWMFASSPGLSAVEHPVYDIWLVDCKGGTEVIAEPRPAVEELPVERPRRQAEQRPGDPALPPGATPAAAPRPAQPQPARRFFPNNQAPINTDRPNDR